MERPPLGREVAAHRRNFAAFIGDLRKFAAVEAKNRSMGRALRAWYPFFLTLISPLSIFAFVLLWIRFLRPVIWRPRTSGTMKEGKRGGSHLITGILFALSAANCAMVLMIGFIITTAWAGALVAGLEFVSPHLIAATVAVTGFSQKVVILMIGGELFGLITVLFHAVAYLFRHVTTQLLIRVMDYPYLMLAGYGVVLKLYELQYKPDVIDALQFAEGQSSVAYHLIAIAIAIRITRTSIEVFGWHR